MKRMSELVDGITLIVGLLAPFIFVCAVAALLSGDLYGKLSATGLLGLFFMYKADRIVDRNRRWRELPAPPVSDQTKDK